MAAPEAPTLGRMTTRLLVIIGSVLLAVSVASIMTAVSVFAHLADHQYGPTQFKNLVDGDCIAQLDWAGSLSNTVDRVPCTTPHAAELIHEGNMKVEFSSYPGETESSDFAQYSCDAANKYHLHVSAATQNLKNSTVRTVYVGREDFDSDPYFRCFLALDNGGMLSRSYYDPDN
jgi:hypothetical protein